LSINAGTGASVTAEVNISDCDIQNCETSEILLIQAVTDVLCAGPLNGSVIGTAAVNCITVAGPCETCLLMGLDVGGGTGTGVLVFESTAGGSPAEIEVGPGTVQQGNAGVVVLAGQRLLFAGLWAKANQGDGWLWSGSGSGNVMTGCGGNTNNKGAGTAYDVDVTGTAHLNNIGFRYISTGVTAGRFLGSSNNYTETAPPSSLTTAGSAPGGW